MNREQRFNQQFVRQIKQHPCLYNPQNTEYRNRDTVENAWTAVAKKCGETPGQCKKRWRNLKTSTARYLKQRRSGAADVKEYYLYEEMKFMIPHLKSKDGETPRRFTAKNKAKMDLTDEDSDNSMHQYEIIESADGYIVTRPADVDENEDDAKQEYQESTHEIVAAESLESYSNEVETEKKGKSSIETLHTIEIPVASSHQESSMVQSSETICPDEMFLKSLLPDITAMTKDQKRKFKIGVLNLVDNILSV